MEAMATTPRRSSLVCLMLVGPWKILPCLLNPWGSMRSLCHCRMISEASSLLANQINHTMNSWEPSFTTSFGQQFHQPFHLWISPGLHGCSMVLHWSMSQPLIGHWAIDPKLHQAAHHEERNDGTQQRQRPPWGKGRDEHRDDPSVISHGCLDPKWDMLQACRQKHSACTWIYWLAKRATGFSTNNELSSA